LNRAFITILNINFNYAVLKEFVSRET